VEQEGDMYAFLSLYLMQSIRAVKLGFGILKLCPSHVTKKRPINKTLSRTLRSTHGCDGK